MKEDGGIIRSILADSRNQTSKCFVCIPSLPQRRSSTHGVVSIIRRTIAHSRTQTLKSFVWIPLHPGPIGSKHSIIIRASIPSSKSSSSSSSSSSSITISILIITRLTMSSPKHSVIIIIIITRSRSCILQLARKTTLSTFQNETKDVGLHFVFAFAVAALTHVRSFSTAVLINPRLNPQ